MKLPAQINAHGLLPFLTQLGAPQTDEEITLDLSDLRRVTPAGLVSLVATVVRWRQEGRPVRFLGLRQCRIVGYLQRMDVLSKCGVELPEVFRRHESAGRFVPVRLIEHPVEEMGTVISACLAPGGEDYDHPLAGLYDFSFYVFTEIANNVRQHSGGVGYASAQVSRTEGMVRLAIADNGMGIRASFQHVGSPWSATADDATAIRRALEPRVSCKMGEPNEGVGLTLVSELARQTRAWLLIVSGSGVLRINSGAEPTLATLPEHGFYQGTMMTMAFRQDAAANYPQLLHEAKVRAGLLRAGRATGRFLA